MVELERLSLDMLCIRLGLCALIPLVTHANPLAARVVVPFSS
jgi:hypothetical protein